MPGDGTLRLELTDVSGKDLNDSAVIELTSTRTSSRYQNHARVKRTVVIRGIESGPRTTYRLMITPSNYRTIQMFVPLEEGKTQKQRVAFPVNPDKVVEIQAPHYDALAPELRRVLESSDLDTHRDSGNQPLQGAQLYGILDPLRKACLLNIFTKASSTVLGDGNPCFKHLEGLIKLRGDRFFARTRAALREETKQSALFRNVPEALHHPPDEYSPAGSFKTNDRYGNLQLTFFRKGETGDDYLVDMDIDEASGIEHVFEVVRNAFAGPTHPYDIREILIRHQFLDPGYSFVFASAAVRPEG